MKKLKPYTYPPLKDLPGFCEQFRIRAQRFMRPSSSGQHIQVWRGQSMEFRDFAQYVPGDDIRYVDWRVSLRSADETKWFVRQFQSEESLHIVISIDTRESMYLPGINPKIDYASWTAEALARIALRSDDKVYFHRLFGKNQMLVPFTRPGAASGILPALRSMVSDIELETPTPQINLEQLDGAFFRHAVWIILSDFYFLSDEDNMQRLAGFIRTQEKNWPRVLLVNYDSWPQEAGQLAGRSTRRAWKIGGPARNDNVEIEATSEVLSIVEQNIRAPQQHFLNLIRHTGFDQDWHWPAAGVAHPLDFFRTNFAHQPPGFSGRQNPFTQLFMRSK